MKNLILADLKVLGHRIWSVPLVAFVLVAGVSLIPNVEMADPVRNFMLALLSPCLLIFELFREEQKRGTDSLMLTMPVSKNVYVMAKYTTVIILSLTALPAGWIAAIFSNLIHGDGLSVAQSVLFLPNMLKIMAFIIPSVFFFIPLYYFSRKAVFSAIGGIALIISIGELLSLFSNYFEVMFYKDSLHLLFYIIGVFLIPVAIIHLIIKNRFRNVPAEIIKTGWFAVLCILFLFVFDMLMNNLQSTDFYFHIVGALDSSEGEKRERIVQLIRSFRLFIPVISFTLLMIGSVIFYIRRKSSQLFWQNLVLYILTPFVIMLFANHSLRFFGGNHQMELITLTISLILFSVISMKVSIYMLENNRTLK